MKALQQEQAYVLEERREGRVAGECGREELPQMTSGDWQGPDPIRLYGQQQENGFFCKGNEKPKGGVKQESGTACYAFCCVFSGQSSCCMQNEPGRWGAEWKQREVSPK